DMNTRRGSQEISIVNSALLAALLLLLCFLAALCHLLFRGDPSSQMPGSRNSFELTRLQADTRTFVAALRYLLEPEPADLKPDSIYNAGLKTLPSESRGQICASLDC